MFEENIIKTLEHRIEYWDRRFLSLADHVSEWSKDPSTKVGAVAVDNQKRILGIGYNGFPRYVDDNPRLYDNRADKLARVVHAEANCILNSTQRDLTEAILYCTHFPCSHCAGLIIQSGIGTIVSFAPSDDFAVRYAESFRISEEMFEDAGIDMWMYFKE